MQFHCHQSASNLRGGDPEQGTVGAGRGQIDFAPPKSGAQLLVERNIFMSYYAGDDPDVPKPWFMKKTVWIIGAVVFLILAAGTISFIIVGMRKVPEIGGGITIEADPDTRIYIGNKFVGTTQVSFTWEELFGDEKHEPMAVYLAWPPAQVTPEMVAEKGVTVLESQT